MEGSLSTRPSLCRGFAIRHYVKPRRTCFHHLFFSPLFEEIEHYETITDIVPLFKVTEKDTCLFERISHTV